MGQRSTPSPTPGPTSTNSSPMERKLKMTQVTDRRRCGVCGPVEGCPCRLVPTIPISHWGLACRGRKSRSGTSQRFTEVHSDPRCGAMCGFRHLGPLPSESCESCQVPVLCDYFTSTRYVTKELPGPSTFAQWRTSFRILKPAIVMLDAVSLGQLRNYEMVIEKLTKTYPTEWRLVYAADELARSARSNRFRAKVLMDTKAGKKKHSKLGFKGVLEPCVHHDLPRRHILAYSGPCTSLDLAVGHRGQLESTGVKAITPQGSEGDSPGLQWPAQGSASSNLLNRHDVNRPWVPRWCHNVAWSLLQGRIGAQAAWFRLWSCMARKTFSLSMSQPWECGAWEPSVACVNVAMCSPLQMSCLWFCIEQVTCAWIFFHADDLEPDSLPKRFTSHCAWQRVAGTCKMMDMP